MNACYGDGFGIRGMLKMLNFCFFLGYLLVGDVKRRRNIQDLIKTENKANGVILPTDLLELIAGSGVFVSRAELEECCEKSNSSSGLARNLFGVLFTFEELSTHSLYGGLESQPRPPIDYVRRDTIIDFALTAYNWDPHRNDPEWTPSEKKSYDNKVRDELYKIKKLLANYLHRCNKKTKTKKPTKSK